MTKPHLHVFIGYDEKQDIAYEVCAESIRSTASRPVSIWKLDHRLLRELKLFEREWLTKGKTGTYEDIGDGRPFSTQFSHSRFCVPALAIHLGIPPSDYVVFVDSDFVFLRDPYEMVEGLDWKEHAVFVVKHDFNPPEGIKMDGQVQSPYEKKLWSSLIVFNMNFFVVRELTPEKVNTMTGRDLHQFKWVGDDSLIGELHRDWNYIPGNSKGFYGLWFPSAVHYTEGVPSMKGYEHTEYAACWRYYERKVYERKLRG